MSALVVLPSYNESGNITDLIGSLLKLRKDLNICVVDDNSPDGTSQVVQKYKQNLPQESQSRLHLITRQKKDGRGGAVRDGFLWGLEQPQNFSAFIEMDCDFSHDPQHISEGLDLLKTHDFVIGARYPKGKIIGWPITRKVLSRCSNFLTRVLIDWSVHDYTNGYRFYTRKAAQFLCEQPQRFKGYIYLSESLAFLLKKGFKGTSFPICFVNRKVGKSNTTLKEIFSAFTAIFQIAWAYHKKS
ncbi:MAG: glycosyltransferase [Bdellovibrionales bacterium]|nr:glycosyltransferase [Bdellovibrionales bacterium]